ncbi:MAG: phage terminase large subunit [Gaiellaceae bacterium]
MSTPFHAALGRRHVVDYLALVVPEYQRSRHVEVIAEHLEAVERTEILRLLIDAPPRHSKSLTVAQGFTSWYLGRNPRREVIVASYGQELSEAHSRRARGFLLGPAWPFPDVQVSAESAAVGRWATNHGGGMRATGVGGSITGHGADVLVLDDLLRGRADADSEAVREAAWRWLTEDALTRLMPGGAVVAVGTRWHEDDPLGRLLDGPGASEWVHLHLPALAEDDDVLGRDEGEALWPAWFPAEHLLDVKVELGSRAFAALYQGAPTPDTGGTFQRAWLAGRYPRLPEGVRKVQTVDASFKTGVGNDFSVVATWAADDAWFYLVDVWRAKVEYPELKRAIVSEAEEHEPEAVLIEDAAAGQSAIQELRRETRLPIVAVKPQGSKVSRAEAVSPLFEAGNVLLPEQAPAWLGPWVEEHVEFPAGKHDDQVDTTTMALDRLRGHGGSHGGVAGSITLGREGRVTWRRGRNGEPRRTVTPHAPPGRRTRERARRAYVNPRVADD